MKLKTHIMSQLKELVESTNNIAKLQQGFMRITGIEAVCFGGLNSVDFYDCNEKLIVSVKVA